MTPTTATINTKLADLPTTVAAYTLLDENGEYTIIINARMSNDRQHQAYEHEMRHIQNNDFEKDDVEKIELEAHELPVPEQNPRPAWVEKHLKKLRKDREKIKQELAEYEEALDFLNIAWDEKKLLDILKTGE